MDKQISFEYKGKKYTLEYTRASIRQMESEGFVASDIVDKPMSTLPKLFAGAFRAHHKFGVKADEMEAMFDLFINKEALLSKLVEMFNEPMEALMSEPDEGNAIAWEANF